MSGHNKWSKIKRKKGVEDAKRSKIFSKIIKEITVAVREGGNADPDFNPRLRMAVTNAKGVNMPKDNIERAIKKASEVGGEQFAELTYEGYGPGGIAIFIDCATDNQNRTISNVRSYFNKSGGNLATNGSVDYLFDRKGLFIIGAEGIDEEEFTLDLIDAGAEDIELEDNEFVITTSFDDYGHMAQKLGELNVDIKSTEIQRIPKTTQLVELDVAKRVVRLIETIEDDDDVQAVSHNMEVTDEIIAEVS